MGNFQLLIGMRLHALIFAAVMERPFVAISYDAKIDGFVKDINGVTAVLFSQPYVCDLLVLFVHFIVSHLFSWF